MDRRDEIRQFLTSRRGRLTPEAAGVPVRGHERRVPGLRREEVAELAGVSVEYYVRLERGNLGGASDAVLDALARALQLDDAERLHLYDLARGGEGSPEDEEVRPSLQRLLDSIGVPAFVRNPRFDHVASNALARALLCEMFESEHPNQARYVFLDPRSMRFYPDWDEVASDFAAMLRLQTGRVPSDRRLAALIEQLLGSPEFRSRWESGNVRLSQSGTEKRFHHPVAGALLLTVESMEIRSSGRLTLWAVTAEPGSDSAAGLARLGGGY
ncbi:helix-turn-helix domain-containing protein [Solirubrobacter soli]|uniref:helix-turn-helix domain-containing protein n=1 Tax=Solirubrobacter soli TaxID=363832 RepID=UPI000416E4E5|nr:helix-turn-helix transcriptional regulator [Solirubrobacter soli]